MEYESLIVEFEPVGPFAMNSYLVGCAKTREGAIIDYVVSLMGIPLRWRSLITAYAPPHRFVDEQILGPYAFWHHTHTFSPVDNGTLVGDRVLYALPLGPLGDLAHALMVGRQLRGIFAHRRRVIEQIFATVADKDTELLS